MHVFDESREMYLETILVLSLKNDLVRSVDVANKLGYSKASVSRAIKNLRKEGSLNVEKNGHLQLTKTGLEEANNIYEKHKTLTRILIEVVKLDPELAERDACRIEHVISDETFEALKKLIE